MNAILIRKRNESVNRMWACLAGLEFFVWVISGLNSHLPKDSLPIALAFNLVMLCLGIAAIIHYLLACEHYAGARGSKNPSNNAGVVFVLASIASFIVVGFAVTHHSAMIFYLGIPIAFALSTLPLKLIRDRGQSSGIRNKL